MYFHQQQQQAATPSPSLASRQHDGGWGRHPFAGPSASAMSPYGQYPPPPQVSLTPLHPLISMISKESKTTQAHQDFPFVFLPLRLPFGRWIDVAPSPTPPSTPPSPVLYPIAQLAPEPGHDASASGRALHRKRGRLVEWGSSESAAAESRAGRYRPLAAAGREV
jgi:hypothetical protein